LGKKILDPACGDGRFLVEIARRIIEQSPKESLHRNLSCLYGWDIDPGVVMLCRRNLDDLAAAHGIHLDWNVGVADALRHKAKPSLFAYSALKTESK
jgi:adenine-specific DNA-methyltransferase